MTKIIKSLYTGRIEGGQAQVIHAETYDSGPVLAQAGPGWTIPSLWKNTINGIDFSSANPKLNNSNQLVWLLIKRDV